MIFDVQIETTIDGNLNFEYKNKIKKHFDRLKTKTQQMF